MVVVVIVAVVVVVFVIVMVIFVIVIGMLIIRRSGDVVMLHVNITGEWTALSVSFRQGRCHPAGQTPSPEATTAAPTLAWSA